MARKYNFALKGDQQNFEQSVRLSIVQKLVITPAEL